MGVVIPIGFAQVSCTFSLTGDAEQMVATVGVDSGTEENPEILADEVFLRLTGAGTVFDASSLATSYRIGPFEATIMTSTGPQTGTGLNTYVGTGSGINPPPQNTSILVQKRTTRGGRQGRGRMYFPPCNVNETNVSAIGVYDSVSLAAYQDTMTEFLLVSASEGAPLVLLHSEAAGPIAPDPITALSVQALVATQRTRLRR